MSSSAPKDAASGSDDPKAKQLSDYIKNTHEQLRKACGQLVFTNFVVKLLISLKITNLFK